MNKNNYITETPDGINKLRDAIKRAEAIVIGAGNGLSISAGLSGAGERFEKYFSDFGDNYGFSNMYAGWKYPFASNEERWGFRSRFIYINRYMDPPRKLYEGLLNLVKDKDYFVITTNLDYCFQRAGFDRHRLFCHNGDYGLFQCGKACHNKTYPNYETIREMLLAQGFIVKKDEDLEFPLNGNTYSSFIQMTVPEDLMPHCPICDELMRVNMREGGTFVEDEAWRTASRRYSEFLERVRDSKTLFLELGVTIGSSSIIKEPFIQMTGEWRDAIYACVNQGEAFAPKDIEANAICINGNIGRIISEL